MKIGLVIYGSLDTLSGGYLYDRMLVDYLRSCGDTVRIFSLPWRNYGAHLLDNLGFKLPRGLDLLIQDELNHPSLIGANSGKHPYPILSLVHHLRCSESRPRWQNILYRIVERTYLQRMDGFIFNSITTKRAVESLVGRDKPAVLAHPPTDRFGEPPSEDWVKARAHRHPLRVLFLGNLMKRKGLHILLDAIKAVSPGLELDIVGSPAAEPAYAGKMRRDAGSFGATHRITFHSSLDDGPLAKLLEQAHLLVVPSSYEGYGIVYLEGMGFGLPAIGTTGGAAWEVIEHGRTGYLIAPGDSAALTGHLELLKRDRELLTRLSLNARRRFLRQPSWRESAGRIRDFLRSQLP
jgi:glycosyltransferase involved in cell wall biosynthesis